jgi:hypothetical protein
MTLTASLQYRTYRQRPSPSLLSIAWPTLAAYRGLATVGTGRSSGATLTLSFKPGHVSQ